MRQYMNQLFTYAFLFFMLVMAIHRVCTTFFVSGQEKGNVSNGWTIYALSIVHISVGISATLEYLLSDKPLNYVITLIGLFMFSVALGGRRWAVNTLGKYHSAHIELRENQPLIRLGPYQYIRHPIYFFIIIELLGFPLIANAYYAFTLSLLLYIPLVLLRLTLEEKELGKRFGNDYLQYQATVSCLIPFFKRHRSDQTVTTEGT
jgi:protein-S-isoprenylcysteine O-methyltransferase Ste14